MSVRPPCDNGLQPIVRLSPSPRPRGEGRGGGHSNGLKPIVWTVGALAAMLALLPAAANGQPARTEAQVEADWLRQEAVRWTGPATGIATPEEDALGGVDGVKNGKWGFHSGIDDNPWWQVDLEDARPISRVLIYNRCDGGTAERAAHLILMLSADGENWTEAYKHDGTVFYGQTDGKPLEVKLGGTVARYVRIQVPSPQAVIHFDEVEVYGPPDETVNLALWKPANQSSASQYSTRKVRPGSGEDLAKRALSMVASGLKLADDLRTRGVDTRSAEEELHAVEAEAQQTGTSDASRELYLRARRAVRGLALRNPLLDFDDILFVKRVPGSYSHMSDQNYGWWSRGGGGVYVLHGAKSDAPTLQCLTDSFPLGSFTTPELSYDGKRVLFAYCTYHEDLAGIANKVDKDALPEDGFYHIYEMNVDGTGLRQVTHGRYDDFNPRYLPTGQIVFLSTRRGQAVQCGLGSAMLTLAGTMPDSYVRCGGDHWRPVAVYTLHVMDPDGTGMRAISPFENFEWDPAVASDGRVIYARWDYVDRTPMPFMSLWSTRPDGTGVHIVYGNFTPDPHCIFQAQPIPGSEKLIFTGSAHHSITGGSLALLDPNVDVDGNGPLTRLTPEVCFPEAEGWPTTYYADPWPLSESYYLTAWSDQPLRNEGGANPANACGIYLYDAFGNLELLYRDPEIGSQFPIPVRPRPLPPATPDAAQWGSGEQGDMLLLDVYKGLTGIERGSVARIRVVGLPAKVQPEMNSPNLGLTRDDPGKFIVGTAPVEQDGSAHLAVPAGVPLFFQALDKDGLAIQTMRTATYIQPGETLTCIGCHEHRGSAPPNGEVLAASVPPSKLKPGPDGTWPLSYDKLVQPVLDRSCVSCHGPRGTDSAAVAFDLSSSAASWERMVSYGSPSLRDDVMARYNEGKSIAGAGPASHSPVLALLRAGHHGASLDPDSLERLVTWMDLYGQRQGYFSDEQEQRLIDLRRTIASVIGE